jgi:Fe-S cluster assembly protein SufD
MIARDTAWLAELRRDSRARFDALGFAAAAADGWSAGDLARLTATPYSPPAEAVGDLPDPPAAGLVLPDAYRLVLIDGRPLAPSPRGARLDGGPWITSLAVAAREAPELVEGPLARRAPSELPALAALGAALSDDGAVVIVPPDLTVDRPVHLVHVATGRAEPTAIHTRSLIVAGRSSHVRIVETHVALGSGAYWTNALADVEVGENASVEHYRIQIENPQAIHVSSIASRLGPASRYVSRRLDFGGRIVHHDLGCVLDGPGAEVLLEALWVARDEQHMTHATVIDHAREHTASREVYKGVLAGRARGSFHGRIVVRPGAQKTDAKQTNPNLLLSESALAHTRPQLEIRADDVKCTHGATIGRLDEDAIFYLRTRGIAAAAARRMLVRAFAGEVLEHMQLEPVRRHGEELLDAALAGIGA